MSRTPVIVVVVAALLALTGCDDDPRAATPPSPSSPTTAPATVVAVPVEGMSCGACAASVRRAVKSVEGVTGVEVDLAQREARVEYEATKVSPDQIVTAINDAGFKAGQAKGEPR